MLNKVMLIGNLGADPEIRYLPNGDAVATLRLATTRRWKDKNGDRKEESEWHRVVLFSGLAKIAGDYLKKGSKVYVEGRIRTQQWEKDGEKRYSTEIVGEELKMLDGKSGGNGQHTEQSNGNSASRPQASAGGDDFSDDIPF